MCLVDWKFSQELLTKNVSFRSKARKIGVVRDAMRMIANGNGLSIIKNPNDIRTNVCINMNIALRLLYGLLTAINGRMCTRVNSVCNKNSELLHTYLWSVLLEKATKIFARSEMN